MIFLEVYWQGLTEALRLLLSGDRTVLEIIYRTLQVSGTATLISVLIGLPLGTVLALSSFPGRKIVVSFINLGMGLPPVVVGLWVWLTLSRYGPLGFLGLLYTPRPWSLPRPSLLSDCNRVHHRRHPVAESKDRLQILALGASRRSCSGFFERSQAWLLAAVIAGFGGVISEVGASIMVGGNLKGSTVVLTTATVLEVNKGNYEIATAFSIILLTLAFGITAFLTTAQQRGR